MQKVLPRKVFYRSQFAAVTRKRPAVNRITKLFLDTLAAAHSGQITEAKRSTQNSGTKRHRTKCAPDASPK
ncbi:hypothetical protein [Leisingera sp.]|uniref:hypothetical protein n=1 Tax=Leisingera sp. TaxID=1879318 RepID=UPI002B271418|nr:hypothetical protein [Leisingera sp.]